MNDQEIVRPETGEIISPEPTSISLFNTSDPIKVVEQASAVAGALATVIDKHKLYSNIQGRKYVKVEGWTLLGSMLGVFPVCVWTRPTDDGWEARVEARTRTGAVVGAAEAQCTRSEKTWASRDDYALRSMAQTRATSKALRLPLGFVVSIAGFEATPAEEVPSGGFDDRREEPADQGNGVCLEHKVPYFMKGNMTRPAHRMGDGWCNKPESAPARRPRPDGMNAALALLENFGGTAAQVAWIEQQFPSLKGKRSAEYPPEIWPLIRDRAALVLTSEPVSGEGVGGGADTSE